jgi:hypothetical protein
MRLPLFALGHEKQTHNSRLLLHACQQSIALLTDFSLGQVSQPQRRQLFLYGILP